MREVSPEVMEEMRRLAALPKQEASSHDADTDDVTPGVGLNEPFKLLYQFVKDTSLWYLIPIKEDGSPSAWGLVSEPLVTGYGLQLIIKPIKNTWIYQD